MTTRYQAWFDGASSGGARRAGIGAVIVSPDGEVVCEHGEPIGKGTNNEAEYKALIWLLGEIVRRGITDVVIHGDSQLVINQVTGDWQIYHGHMYELCAQARSLMVNIPRCSLQWVPREENEKANVLSHEAANYPTAQPKPFTGRLERVSDHVYLAYGTDVYAVDLRQEACTCPAFTTQRVRPCKHLLAVHAHAQRIFVEGKTQIDAER